MGTGVEQMVQAAVLRQRTPAEEWLPRPAQAAVLALFDLFGLWLAWQLSLAARLWLNPWMPLDLTRAQLELAAPPAAAILGLWILASTWTGAYRKPVGNSLRRRATGLLEAAIMAGMLNIVATFLWREFGVATSRSFVFLFLPASLLTLAPSRWAALRLLALAERQWPAPERVGVIGRAAEARPVVEALRASGRNLWVTGVIVPETGEDSAVPVRILGDIASLGSIINLNNLERLVIVNRCLPDDEEERCERIARRMGVTVSQTIGPWRPEVRLSVVSVGELSLLEMRPAALRPGQERLKRAFDIVVASAVLLVLAPLLALIALAVKLSSPGPVFYLSPRVGRGGKRFPFFKFRSMYTAQTRQVTGTENEKSGHIYKVRGDRRVTAVGRILRRYSLDELPQLWNVLRGEMSLVGPRPLPAEDLDTDGMSRAFSHWAEQRSRVLPGISGLWQVSGRSDLAFDDMVRLDVEYIERWSLWLDLRILMATPLVVVRGKGAY